MCVCMCDLFALFVQSDLVLWWLLHNLLPFSIHPHSHFKPFHAIYIHCPKTQIQTFVWYPIALLYTLDSKPFSQSFKIRLISINARNANKT
jgi:hypothetical protein